MPRVTFGNTHVITKHPITDVMPDADPDDSRVVTVHHDHIEQTESVFDVPPHWVPDETPSNLDEWSRDETFRSITNPGGFWAYHSPDKPAWVDCADWPELEAILRVWYGVDGRPDGWEHAGINAAKQLRVELPDAPARTEGD